MDNMNQIIKPCAIGIDIGGTNTKLGIVHINGKVDHFQSIPTMAGGNDPNAFLNKLERLINNLMMEMNCPCKGVGIATGGYLDAARHGPIVCRNTPALKGFDLLTWSEQKFGLRTIVNNDLIAHALAEYYFGRGKDARRFMCMAVGTGFGIGVIIDGKPLRIVGGTTGDAGRIILEPNGIKCNYGVSGSVEALVGVKNIERMACERYGDKMSAYDVIRNARCGKDRISEEIIYIIGEYLGFALASLSAIFLPEKVAITGGTAEAGDVLLNACKMKFNELVGEYHQLIIAENKEFYQGMEIYLGKNRAESGMLGAVVELFSSLLAP